MLKTGQTFLAVVLRELAERRLVFAAAFLLGLMPLCAPWLPFTQHYAQDEVMGMTAFGVQVGFCCFLALMLGSALFSGDLVERRLGFYYARPISSLALWGGKLTAALILLTVGGLLIWLPSILAGGQPWRAFQMRWEFPLFRSSFVVPWWNIQSSRGFTPIWRPQSPEEQFMLMISLLVLTLLLSHLIALSLRVRSLWIALDFFLLPSLIGMVLFASGRLAGAFAYGGLWPLYWRLWGVLVMAALLAIWAQLYLGRTSAARTHGVGSLTFWTAVFGLGLVSLTPFLWPLARTTPKDLIERTHIQAAPQGEWLVMAGPVGSPTGLQPAFAVHSETGLQHRLGLLPLMPAQPLFSADGQTLVWSQCSQETSGGIFSFPEGKFLCEVHWLDLNAAVSSKGPPKAPSGITFPPTWRHRNVSMALRGDGQFLALWSGENLAVYELASRRLVASIKMPFSLRNSDLQFVADERLRIVGVQSREGGEVGRSVEDLFLRSNVQIWEMDLASSALELAGEVPGSHFTVDPWGQRLAVGTSRKRIEIFEGPDVERQMILEPKLPHWWNLRFLPSGRMIVATGEKVSPVSLRVFAPDGQRIRDCEFGHAKQFLIGDEPSPGLVLLGLRKRETSSADPESLLESQLGNFDAWETHLFQLDTGESLAVFPGRVPLVSGMSSTRGLLIGKWGDLERLDLASNSLQALAIAQSGS